MSPEELFYFLIKFFLAGLGLPFTIYLVIQILAILFVSGPAKRAVWIPLPIMSIVLVVSMVAFSGSSNMWPIWLILASPLAIIYVGAVWLVHVLKKKQRAPQDQQATQRDP